MSIAVVWFTRDLRTIDHPALYHACQHYDQVVGIYAEHPEVCLGGAQRLWINDSFQALQQDLDKLNIPLYYTENFKATFETLITSQQVDVILWNRQYSAQLRTDMAWLKTFAKEHNVEAKSFNGVLLAEPWQALTQQQTPFKVYTAFKNNLLKNIDIRAPYPNPQACASKASLDNIASLTTTITHNHDHPWQQALGKWVKAGEVNAWETLETFIEHNLCDYDQHRDRLYPCVNSHLAPYIALGEISVHSIYNYLHQYTPASANRDKFIAQLIWRDFSYSLLYYYPELPSKNYLQKFDPFEWLNDMNALHDWQKGQTGIPLIDAGMQELWQSGIMHNRVRMVVASWLTKNTLTHWHHGAQWFLDTLFDADLANNSASWQWVAGSGADAAPYFRVFNPVLQSTKFDPDGFYIKKWLPQLRFIPTKYIHEPWLMPESIQQQSQCIIGKDYPKPSLDLKVTRIRALERYNQIKSKSSAHCAQF